MLNPDFSRAEQRMNQIEQQITMKELKAEGIAVQKGSPNLQGGVSTSAPGQAPDFKSVAKLMYSQMMMQSMDIVTGSRDNKNSNDMFGSSNNMLNMNMLALMKQQSGQGFNVDPNAMMNNGLWGNLPSYGTNNPMNFVPNKNNYRPIQAPEFPVDNGRVSSHFNTSHDHFIDYDHRKHLGVDIAAAENTPIKAPWNGQVVFVGHADGFGSNTVIVAHPETAQPNGKILYSVFGHNNESYVQAGDQVGKGSVIATVGSDGHSTGPHLHWETRWAEPGLTGKDIFKQEVSTAINPLNFA